MRNWALKRINLIIKRGESIGIIGPNESGKTTLVKAMNGLIPHKYPGIMKGEIKLFNTNSLKLKLSDITRKIGLVFSDPDSQFTSMSVEEEIVFGLENISLKLKEIKKRMKWIKKEMKLREIFNKPPTELSGGQKQRVAISSIIAMKPEILILDEPTSMLDPNGKREVFSIIKKIKEKEEITLIIVEHNIQELIKVVDRIIFLRLGKKLFDVSVKEFLKLRDKVKDEVYIPEDLK